MVADHTFACQIFYTDNKLYSWVRLDFKGSSVCPNYYTMAHRAGFDGYYLRDWQLQASNDAQEWVVLEEHKADESLNKKNLVAAWPVEGVRNFYRFFQVVIAPNGNSSGTNALILSCLEFYGRLRQPVTPVASTPSPQENRTIEGSNHTTVSVHGWQTLADGSRPLPFRVVGSGRLPPSRPMPTAFGHSDLMAAEATTVCTGRVVSVSWQGGAIQLTDYPDAAELVPYHKSDVWVDDKKVKQLPREGDIVSFYIVMDDVTKKDKAEQVTVVTVVAPRQSVDPEPRRTPRPTAKVPEPLPAFLPVAIHGPLDAMVMESWGTSPLDNGTRLNPAAPSFMPRSGTEYAAPTDPVPARAVVPSAPQMALATTIGGESGKSSFLFEHCTGHVVFVSVPTGQIQIDGAPEDAPTIPYHYSDVWDDGKCVKQFPRIGDTVSCYIGIDPKTKNEKAENVKVIYKRPQASHGPARTQVQQTIQNARYRAAANAAHASTPRPGLMLPMPHFPGSSISYGPPSLNYGECVAPLCSASYGRPQPMVQPPVHMFPLMHYGPPPFQSGALGPMSPPRKGLSVHFNTFAPVVAGSPVRIGVAPPGPSTPSPHTSTPTPALSPILPMQYLDGASPLLYAVGAARPSPPPSLSPSPSMGTSSGNSSVGTLNLSCGEVDQYSHPNGSEAFPHHTPSQSPFDMDVDTLACMASDDVAEEYHRCHTPMKQSSSLSAWTAGDCLAPATPERPHHPRLRGGYDTLDTLLPRSPIIGDIMRSTGVHDLDDQLQDHDLLSGDTAFVAMHAVSVVDF